MNTPFFLQGVYRALEDCGLRKEASVPARLLKHSKNPFFQAEARNYYRTGSFKREMPCTLPDASQKNMRATVKALKTQLHHAGLDPKKVRIAIAGSGGSGKSTLATAIAKDFGIKHRNLDWESTPRRQLMGLAKDQQKFTFHPGTVAEQVHVLNNIDPDAFDAIIHVHPPLKTVKAQALNRGRGAFQLAVLDYPKLQKVIETGFKKTEGPSIALSQHIDLKIKPAGGFNAQHHLDQALKKKNINPKGLHRHQKLLSLVDHKKRTSYGGGFLPYLTAPKKK